MQLVQARDGQRVQPAAIAFTADEIAALHAIEADQYAPRTAKQQNPHPKQSLLGRLDHRKAGRMDGYSPPNLQDPSPSTCLDYFTASPKADLRNV